MSIKNTVCKCCGSGGGGGSPCGDPSLPTSYHGSITATVPGTSGLGFCNAGTGTITIPFTMTYTGSTIAGGAGWQSGCISLAGTFDCDCFPFNSSGLVGNLPAGAPFPRQYLVSSMILVLGCAAVPLTTPSLTMYLYGTPGCVPSTGGSIDFVGSLGSSSGTLAGGGTITGTFAGGSLGGGYFMSGLATTTYFMVGP